ncbi:MAG: GTP-binding protein, partial [Solimonas sp.]
DTLAQERQRGITIKSAVAAFVVGDVAVNLIDTPGHPDFIAEVERVLNALDGAVLVISAVEGVQAQTRVLMRTLRRLHIPYLIFVNKIDRRGARHDALLQSIAEKLTPAIVGMGATARLGTPGADFVPYGQDDGEFRERLAERLADGSNTILADYLEGDVAIPYRRLRDELAAQSRRGLVHPVFFGSAITGAGIETLLAGIVELLPCAAGDARASASGTVFKIERGISGEKIAYVRMFSGTLRARDRLQLHGREQKVTAISVFDRGAAHPRPSVVAGQIAKLRGLEDVRIGDAIGAVPSVAAHRHFAPPTLETIVVARRAGDRRALHAALVQLAEQDPLINLRQDGVLQELSVSLYGEVQKEILQETLAADFGIEVEFRGTTTICIERPIGTGTALMTAPDPFVATIGLRLEPAPAGSGVEFRLEVESG